MPALRIFPFNMRLIYWTRRSRMSLCYAAPGRPAQWPLSHVPMLCGTWASCPMAAPYPLEPPVDLVLTHTRVCVDHSEYVVKRAKAFNNMILVDYRASRNLVIEKFDANIDKDSPIAVQLNKTT